MRDELKMGDEVEVLVNPSYWEKTIFIKKGKDISIIVVNPSEIEFYNKGIQFETQLYYNWRIPKELKYRPFTFEDRELFRGKWIRFKGCSTHETQIIAIFSWGVRFEDINCSYEKLFKDYEFTDGDVCGVEIKE